MFALRCGYLRQEVNRAQELSGLFAWERGSLISWHKTCIDLSGTKLFFIIFIFIVDTKHHS